MMKMEVQYIFDDDELEGGLRVAKQTEISKL